MDRLGTSEDGDGAGGGLCSDCEGLGGREECVRNVGGRCDFCSGVARSQGLWRLFDSRYSAQESGDGGCGYGRGNIGSDTTLGKQGSRLRCAGGGGLAGGLSKTVG